MDSLMVAVVQQKPLTFDEFFALYSDDNRYELIDGEVFDLEPTGSHEEIAAFIDRKLSVQIDGLALPYLVLQRGIIKTLGGWTSFRPDIMVLDRSTLSQEPLWAKESIITLGSSIKFVAEVVSGNWQNDYARKVEDYSLLGIPEYWIVDHEALGGVDFIGRPKQPTLTVCILGSDGCYEKFCLRGDDQITSPTFPELKLTADQVLGASQKNALWH
jgi:Uma2 family endonuclease